MPADYRFRSIPGVLCHPGLLAVALAVALVAFSAPALAQETDTLRTPADSLQVPADSLGAPADTHRAAADSIRAPADSLRAAEGAADSLRLEAVAWRAASDLPPVGFADPEPGVAVGDTLPARLPAVDGAGLLAGVPGSFVYDLGAEGWPHGWSPRGLDPNRVALLLNGLPFTDLLTGRPLFDLLPLGVIDPLRLGETRLDRTGVVYAPLRSFLGPQPLTELRYQKGAFGLQRVDVLHMQRRRQVLFATPGVLHLLAAYGGSGADGEYAGTRLRRARQLQARIRYEQPGWSVELYELNSRRRVGAHSGVQPLGASSFEDIFFPLLSDIVHADAWRGIRRNDLSLTLRARLLPGFARPLTASTYWTRQLFEYHSGDTSHVSRISRYGLRLDQSAGVASHDILFRVEAYDDRVAGRRPTLHASVLDSFSLGTLSAALEAAAHFQGGVLRPGGVLRLRRDRNVVSLFAGASLAGQPASLVESHGFGGYVETGAFEPPAGRVVAADAGVTFRRAAFDLTVIGFYNDTSNPRDLFATERRDTVVVRTMEGTFQRAGAAADAGWRRHARRGLYAVLQPTLNAFFNPGASEAHTRSSESLPALHGRGRLGVRINLFQGDLDLDVHLEGRGWSAMRGRTFHPPTGLLVLPAADARVINPSGTLDLVVEAGIRTARIHLAYENLLARTELILGSMVVPTYPLQGRRFRFGVHWPIFD